MSLAVDFGGRKWVQVRLAVDFGGRKWVRVRLEDGGVCMGVAWISMEIKKEPSGSFLLSVLFVFVGEVPALHIGDVIADGLEHDAVEVGIAAEELG